MLGRLRLDPNLILLPLLLLVVPAPLFHEGYLQTASGALPIYDLLSFQQGPGFSWTPPIGAGFSPLPYFLGSFLDLFLRDDIAAMKALFGLSYILSGLGMYFFANRLFKSYLSFFNEGKEPEKGIWRAYNAVALLAAILYAYAPFQLVSLYVLGDPALAIFLALLPWAAFAFLSLELASRSANILAGNLVPATVASLLLVFLVFSNPGLGILSGILIVAITCPASSSFLVAFRRKLPAFLIGCAGGVLLVLPRLSGNEMTSGFALGDGFVDLAKLFSPTWSYGATPAGGLPVQLGVIPMAMAAVVIAGAFGVVTRVVPEEIDQGTDQMSRWQIQLGIALVLVIVLMLPISKPVWGVLGKLISQPFYLLSLAMFIIAVLGAAVVMRMQSSAGLAVTALIVAAIVAIYGYLTPRYVDFGEPEHFVDARFGNVLLLDYAISGNSQASNGFVSGRDNKLELTLLWQAQNTPKGDLTVFTHVTGQDQKVWGQKDNKPVGGTKPTNTWQAGEVVIDKYSIDIGEDVPPGNYTIEVGLYDATTGERAIATSNREQKQSLLLDKVTIN